MQTLFKDNADAILKEYDCASYPSPRDAAVAVGTDFMFTCPARRVLRAAYKGGTAIASRYFFTHRYASAPFDALQSFHASELSFVFQTFNVLKYSPTPGDLEVSNAMDGYWAGLANAGDPNHAGSMSWPRYDADADPAIVFDSPLTTMNGVRSGRCDFWDTISLDE
jgi:carboxylesterase type B